MSILVRPVLVAGLTVLCAVVPAVSANAQTDDEVACRRTMSKTLGKFVATAFKELNTCHRKRNAGKLPLATDCNDLFSVPGGKAVAAYDKASARMLEDCPDSLNGVLAQFAHCPSPHSTLDDDDATSGIDSFAEATDCVLNLAATLANGATATVLGHPGQLPSPAAAKCQAAIGKAFRKRVGTIGKVRRSCQGDADRDGMGVSYSCATADDGKITENLADFVESITRSCSLPQEELVPLHACGQTASQIIQCAGGISTVLGGGLVAEGYELPSTCKLGLALLSANAGLGEKVTATRFELGSDGLGQGVDLLDNFLLGANITCNDDCVDCSVTLNPLKSLPQSFCRCDADPTIHCDTIDGLDADDCGGGGCTCMFAPPLPLSTSGVPACVVNKFVEELGGNLDGGTGVSTTTIFNTAVVHLGDTQLRPCPTCDGDATASDGVRDGTCTGGARDGLSCDENGDSPDFGPVSYDCLPSPGANISGSGLELEFDLTSVDAPTLSTDLMDGANEVYCLQCSGDTAVGCSSDAYCADRGLGTCSVNTGPQARANACDDNFCTASGPASEGECLANAPDTFCDGITRNDGSGLLTCGNNADCMAFDPVCPGGDCGDCALLQRRACFPDPMGAVGSDGQADSVPSAGVYGADLVGTLCVPATGDVAIDTSVGLPGPARLLLNFDFVARCSTNPTMSFELPGGSNCP